MTLFEHAQRYIGIRELSGAKNHPLIQWWLSLCGFDMDSPDEIPWCSAFINGIAWDLRLPRSKSAKARSWLDVGIPIFLHDANLGDIVILKRNNNPEQGHVGLYAGVEAQYVMVLGGNQSDSVCLAKFNQGDVLGLRRITDG
jgi:uncharacterized protein (TIGR02594 family)